MVLVMNNDFNMEKDDKLRAVDDSGENESVLDNVRVDFGDGKCGIDENRVLGDGGYRANGEFGVVEGVRVSSNGEVDGDEEIDVRRESLEGGDAEKGEFEMTECEQFSGGRRDEGLGSGKKKKSSLLIREDFGGEDEYGHWRMDGKGGKIKGARQRDSTALVSKNVSGDGNTDSRAVRSVSTKLLGTEFEMGDMVWGKVKSHPWWPGHLFNEAFATSSVRRTRRDGDLLVAFFGDSSYGWFAPSELVPYDPHYAEKSQQTVSKSFVRAVEESVDEASRRSALGLSCRCRNPSNFRPTDVPGYAVVDVVGYEPGAVYSRSQIQKARDAFQPAAVLSFLLQSAVTPMDCDNESLDFVKNKACLFAYRRAKYEEVDETYAEAFSTFGHKPVRRSQLAPSSADKEPSRAPLSGPLVFAETPGSRKSSIKSVKLKEQNRKDKYLLKRRDDSADLRTSKSGQDLISPSSSSAYEVGTSDSAAGGYVFQKRDQGASANNELGEVPITDEVETSAPALSSEDTNADRTSMMDPDVPRKRSSLGETAMSQHVSDEFATSVKHMGSVAFTDVGIPASGGSLKKKKKAPKRPSSDLSSEKPEFPKKKIKKAKKSDDGRSLEHIDKPSAGPANLMGKPSQIVSSREDAPKAVEAVHTDPQHGGLVSLSTVGESEAEVRQILADLRGLALNPCHGMERNGPAVTRQFLLRFRSMVFLKSSSASAATDSEPSEVRASRFPGPETTDRPPTESSKTVPSLKSSKLSAKHDDPIKGGRKRIPSERQEEIAVKRAKKISDVKSLSAEKRAPLKNPEFQQSDGKKVVAHSPHGKPFKAEHHGKKAERPPRVEEPTFLMMKFQSGSSLPSLVELKARFARFGPLDTSLSRVFYKTDTCRVAFLYKQDAHVAYRYAVGSKSLFANVKFLLKPVAPPESQQPGIGKAEELQGEPVSNWDSPSSIEARQAALAALTQPVQQLKSCLKKPSGGDESTGTNNGGGNAKAPRVRFIMADDNNSASNKGGPQVQSMESRNPDLSSFGGPSSSSSSSSVAMDVNNNQRFMSPLPLQPPLFPHPPNFVRPPMNHPHHHVEVNPRNNLLENVFIPTSGPGTSQVLPPPPPPPAPRADISQQMMSLLMRCHEVVTNVKSTLGYVPYHPL